MQLITKEQADFIKTFNGEKSRAIHHISRWGWGHYLTDGNNHTYKSNDTKPFNMLDEKLKMIDAVINGYEVKKDEKWVLATDIYVKGERVTIYYQGTIFVPADNIQEANKFNTKEEAEDHKALMKLNSDYVPIPLND